MARTLLIVHRYLGVAVGLLMAMWCLSGAVMMYVNYPALSAGQTLRGLAPLRLDRCCRLQSDGLAGLPDLQAFTLEMLIDTPVLRLHTWSGASRTFDLVTGTELAHINASAASQVASGFAARSGIPARVVGHEVLGRDQWTVAGGYRAHRPLHRFRFADTAATDLYVSGRTGEVVLATTAPERFWNWLGAVPHWLYPTLLREHVHAWSLVVIWTSLAGCFLTLTGLYVGVTHLRTGGGNWSPYRGFSLWHHLAGLFCGVFALSWVLSGLLSMNPWGLLEGADAQLASRRLQGSGPTADDVQTFLASVPHAALSARTVKITSASLDGRLYAIAQHSDGNALRLDGTASRVALEHDEIAAAADRLANGAPIRSSEMLARDDAYYYSHHDAAKLPVYRIVLADAEDTRFYLDPISGELLAQVDSGQRWYRWLHHGLHSLDFSAALRRRPLWDGIMLLLLAGAAVLCVSGAYLALRRAGRDLRLLK